MFVANQITVSRQGKKLLDKVSLSIKPGQLLAVVGPNGAGKSTLLKAFANEFKADSNAISLNGTPMNRWSACDQAKLRAILPQSSALGFPFKVTEVVMMGRSPFQRQLGKRNQEIVKKAIQMARVEHLSERTFTTLSGGERQRVQLARVLAQIWPDEATSKKPARYLLLDEPTSALDLPHQHHVLNTAKQLVNDQGMGVLVVLHDLNLAAMYADQIAIMQAGNVVYEGSPHDCLSEVNIQTVFGVKVKVIPHPNLDCPLIISLDGSAEMLAEQSAISRGKQ